LAGNGKKRKLDGITGWQARWGEKGVFDRMNKRDGS
jgi:hypothetical protein